MAGNGKFDLDSSTVEPGFTGSYKGNHSGPTLDRPGSFREGGESRSFPSGNNTFRSSRQHIGGSSTSLQGLMLEPMPMEDLKKNSCSGELTRVLNLAGLASEESSLVPAHSRPIRSAAVEALKQSKVTFSEINSKARVKRLNENLHKLDKISEAPNTRKQQRTELSTNERSIGSNLKIGAQINRNSLVDDRAKNGVLNKRVRTSMAETQTEARSNGISRQPMAATKNLDLLKDSVSQPDTEEKIRPLPAGGEGWHQKMRRKRSVSKVLTRSLDINGDPKRSMHKSFCNEGGGSQGNGSLRSGFFNGNSGSPKKGIISSPVILNTSAAMPKHEQDTDKLIVKGNIIREENRIGNTIPVTKTKASRAPRGGPSAAVSISTNIIRSGAPEICKQSANLNKIHTSSGSNNKKRSIPSGSTSSMTQWGGQRPQKISRTRRTNVVSPVSNPDDTQVSADGYSPSNFEARINSSRGFRDGANGKHHLKMKVENASSPARFSEGEESGAGGNRMKEKGTCISGIKEKAGTTFPSFGTLTMLAKKNKSPIEDIGDCVPRQGRNGRGSPFSNSSTSPMRDKMENAATANPLRSARPNSDKNGSKTGRPPKKPVDRKGLYRKGHIPNGDSPDITGESDDDHEELLTSASFASNPSYLVGSNAFWKYMEIGFAPVSSQDSSYLAQQLQVEEKLNKSLPQMTGHDSNYLDDTYVPAAFVSGAVETDGVKQKEEVNSIGSVDWLKFKTPPERSGSEKGSNKHTPLYQRVLSALIAEDEIEEIEEGGTERNAFSQYAAHSLSCNEPSRTDGKEGRYQLHFGTEMEKQSAASMYFSYDGVNGSVGQNLPCSVDKSQEKIGFSREVGGLTGFCKNSLGGSPFAHSNGFGHSYSDNEYEQLCIEDKILLELHNVGIYPETVPDLDDHDDASIVEETIQFTEDCYRQQVVTTKESLDILYGAVLRGKEEEKGALEQVAMDRLVELGYKKLQASEGSNASKSGTPKVSKHVALAFVERTLARCRVFEDSGVSCLNEKPFRDVLFAEPTTPYDETEPANTFVSTRRYAEQHGSSGNLNGVSSDLFGTSQKPDKGLSIGVPNQHRGKKRDIPLDDVSGGGGASAFGAKRKRNEKETSNGFATSKNDHLSTCSNGDVKTKTNPKQKTTRQLSSAGNAFVNNKSTETNRKKEGGRNNNLEKSSAAATKAVEEEEEPLDLANFPLPEMDTIDELGAGGIDMGGGGQQDLASWLNFDDTGLQEEDQDFSMEGLQIPMDDIAGLNMF
ncbi:uncharacterized protein LOC124924035 isoform X2 [Impatiens glandulifera]|uniref:uncharacterized protein LOC124924035 isoform X2 n=1 Tax=Impatiens glandulifera TaxID=253017 RepID=UPI001FB14A06|nr:uncharacterized protein LOC124924035 isoform X2 [Impatiens glandulifera]